MPQKLNDVLNCEIYNIPVNKDTSSKLWGEKIEAGEEFDDVKVI